MGAKLSKSPKYIKDLREGEGSANNGIQAKEMTIRYSNGRAVEAMLLSREDKTMRVAIQGEDDVAEFRNIEGTWVSEYSEPVQIEFAWQRKAWQGVVTEADCCCSAELAARLVDMLITGTRDANDASTRTQGEAPEELWITAGARNLVN